MFEEDGSAGEWKGNWRGFVSSDLEEILGVVVWGCFVILAITSEVLKNPGGYRQNAAALWGCFCSWNEGIFWEYIGGYRQTFFFRKLYILKEVLFIY